MPQPNLRTQIGQLLDTWHRDSLELTPQSLTLALLPATQTDDGKYGSLYVKCAVATKNCSSSPVPT